MAGIILKSCKWPLSSSDSASSCLNPPCYREKIQTTATALEAYWAENESRIPVFRVESGKWLPAQDEILLSLHESVPISRNIKASTRWAVITHRLIEKTSQDRTVTAVSSRFQKLIKVQKPALPTHWAERVDSTLSKLVSIHNDKSAVTRWSDIASEFVVRYVGWAQCWTNSLRLDHVSRTICHGWHHPEIVQMALVLF